MVVKKDRGKTNSEDEKRLTVINCQHDHNIVSCVLLHFINAVVSSSGTSKSPNTNVKNSEEEERGSLSEFSRSATLYMAEVDYGERLQMVRRYVEEVEKALAQLGSLVTLEFVLKTPLTIHTRWPYLPIEIGLAWHPILDVPYIPASSLKGAMRHYAKTHNLCDWERLFGAAERTGEAIVLDAYPVEAPRVVANPRGTRAAAQASGARLVEPDIINPHYREDILTEHKASPTPLVYPVVPIGAKFKVILWARQSKDIECLANIATKTLEEGIGARVTVGYGKMHKSP